MSVKLPKLWLDRIAEYIKVKANCGGASLAFWALQLLPSSHDDQEDASHGSRADHTSVDSGRVVAGSVELCN